MTKIKLSAALALTVLSIVLIYQNTAPVEIRFLFITMEMPRAVLLTMVLLIGIAVGILISLAMSGKAVGRETGGPAAKTNGSSESGEP